jgi:integrase/recombinase XerD
MTDDQPAAITSPPRSLAALSAEAAVPLDRNPAAVYLASLGEGSRRTMHTALNTIAGLLGVGEVRDVAGHDVRCLAVPWSSLRYQHTIAIRAELQNRYAPATANKLLAALRRVLREARRLGQMSADDYDQAADIRNIRGIGLPRGRALADGEVAGLMRACAEDATSTGARDAAIIALLRGTGLRRSEVVALDLADYNPETGTLKIRSAKGQKDRLTYVANGPKAAMDAWLDVRGDAPGPLFYGVTRSGWLVVRRLAGQAIAVICAARAREAGVAAFTPHDMRRTFISGLLDAGADIATVQRLAGHEDPATTSRYDRRGEAVKQRAIELVHVPYYPRRDRTERAMDAPVR